MRTIALRLSPGADLETELLTLGARERVRAGWVLTCVGSLSQARLRLAGGISGRRPVVIIRSPIIQLPAGRLQVRG
jgi:predicted DNA-binding protein with PD1-like motif